MNCPLVTLESGATDQGTWPLVTTRDLAFTLDRDFGRAFRLMTGDQILATHVDGRLVVHSGYASDGYSPVLPLPRAVLPFTDPWIRLTPTPSCGFGPSIIHDITRQFLPVDDCPWDRKQTDTWFYNCLVAGGMSKRLAGVYHYAVAGTIGSLYIKLSRKPDPALKFVYLS